MAIYRFNPFVEKDNYNEAEKVPLVAGAGTFKILGVYDKGTDGSPLVDKNGYPKLSVSMSVKDCNGNVGKMRESLTVNNGFKVKQILESLGLAALFDPNGSFNPADIVGGEGKCILKDKPASNGFDARVEIGVYVKAQTQAKVQIDYSNKPGFEDALEGLPF